MPHFNRQRTANGHVLALLLATITLLLAGAGAGFWFGQHTGMATLFCPVTEAESSQTETPSTTSLAPPADAQAKVAALAARIGEMQAQLLRLDALGERLVQMSGLSEEEFDFSTLPPQGDAEPAEPAEPLAITTLGIEAEQIASLIDERMRRLGLLEGAMIEYNVSASGLPSGWPVRKGYISSRYGYRYHPIHHRRILHKGIDIASPRGTPIRAVADGIVTRSESLNGYGRMVELRHLDGVVTRYAHNSKNLVKVGQIVERGQRIALVGASGAATGPHVHFEVRIGDQVVNPAPYLAANADPERLRRHLAQARAEQPEG